MSKQFLVVTAVGRDKVGTVELITDVIANQHANIEESRMARLGGEFAVIMLISLAGNQIEVLEDSLQALEQKGLTLVCKQTNLARATEFQGYIPYEISVIGADHEGIIYRVARYLAAEGINVEEMETHVTHAPNTGTPLFSMRSMVQVPPDLSLRQLRNKLTDVGEEIDVDIDIGLPKS